VVSDAVRNQLPRDFVVAGDDDGPAIVTARLEPQEQGR
jgi:hypothetical protein